MKEILVSLRWFRVGLNIHQIYYPEIMLIDAQQVKQIMDSYGIKIKGILHVGAHECEERSAYNSVWGVKDENIVWVDGNEQLVAKMTSQGVPNCYHALLDETEGDVTFKITNNGQSSSILDFGTHQESYPWCVVTERRQAKTQRLDQFFERTKLDPARYNIWNFDIQGSEYHVFRGAEHLLQYADVIYTEVNTQDVYKGCGKMSQIDTLLEEYGLKRVMERMTDAHWGDAIYVRAAPYEAPKDHPFGTMTLAIPTMKRFKPFLETYLPKYLQLPHVDEIVIADETGEDIDQILQQPWGTHPKLRLLRNPERYGAYHNKLQLMKQCKTDWIALIDSDNEATPEYFTALHEFWKYVAPSPSTVYIPGGVETRDINETKTTRQIAHLAGHLVTRENWNSFRNLHNASYCLNLGNCVFHRTQINDIPSDVQKDVMVDCQVVNKALVEKGRSLQIVPNMKYYHIVHPGSLYLTTMHEQQRYTAETDWTIHD